MALIKCSECGMEVLISAISLKRLKILVFRGRRSLRFTATRTPIMTKFSGHTNRLKNYFFKKVLHYQAMCGIVFRLYLEA